jgi:hypothetical protein
MWYMVTKFIKKMIRAKGRNIRTKEVIRNLRFLYKENPIKRRKYLIRINAHVI